MSEEISEHQLQSKSFLWHHNAFPEYRNLLFHVNNKAKNEIEGNKMKALGVRKGIPDLIYLFKGKMYGIEMKTEMGTLSIDQKKVHELWKVHEVQVYICRSVDQFKEIIIFIHENS